MHKSLNSKPQGHSQTILFKYEHERFIVLIVDQDYYHKWINLEWEIGSSKTKIRSSTNL